MEYFKINNVDYSMCVSGLKITKGANYNAQTNAGGNTVVDLVNQKREIEVKIIPLDASKMMSLLMAIDAFNVSLSFRNPLTNDLEENVNVIIPSNDVENYTIQSNKVFFKEITLKFTEL